MPVAFHHLEGEGQLFAVLATNPSAVHHLAVPKLGVESAGNFTVRFLLQYRFYAFALLQVLVFGHLDGVFGAVLFIVVKTSYNIGSVPPYAYLHNDGIFVDFAVEGEVGNALRVAFASGQKHQRSEKRQQKRFKAMK